MYIYHHPEPTPHRSAVQYPPPAVSPPIFSAGPPSPDPPLQWRPPLGRWATWPPNECLEASAPPWLLSAFLNGRNERKFEQQPKNAKNAKFKKKCVLKTQDVFVGVFLLLEIPFPYERMDDCPTIGSLTTQATCCEFMVLVRRLVQFCLASVKGFFLASSSLSLYLQSMFVSSFKPTILNGHVWVHQHLQSDFNLPFLHLWNLRNCVSMAWFRNPEGLFGHGSETRKVYLDVRNNFL